MLASRRTKAQRSEIFKRHTPVLHVFFSSACRILLDLWTFSPVRARALLEIFSAPGNRSSTAVQETLRAQIRHVNSPDANAQARAKLCMRISRIGQQK